jgi:Na+/serine symporter
MPNFLGATANEDTQPHLQLIGTLIVAVVYGFITCLFLHTISLLITNTKHSYTSTMRLILIIYIAVMYSFSTGSAIQAFVYITGTEPASTATTRTPNIINMNEPMFLPLAICGADGFMVSLYASDILTVRLM